MVTHSVLRNHPSLRTLGFAVQYFPRYVHTTPHLHSVDVVLMSVIIRGRGRHIMGERVYEETTGSVGITHYGQVHDILTSGRTGMDIYNVYLDLRGHPLPQVPPEFAPTLAAILPLHPKFVNRLNRNVHFSLRFPHRMDELLARIQRELDERPAGFAEAAQLGFRLFLIECGREAMHSGIVPRPTDLRDYPRWLDRIRKEIDGSYARRMSLDDLAEESRVSKGHLCRLFKAYTGRTVFQYVVEKRVATAMLRLRAGRDKVLAIAMECGFNDISYFNRTFRRLTGQSPREYREAQS